MLQRLWAVLAAVGLEPKWELFLEPSVDPLVQFGVLLSAASSEE